MGSIHRLRGFPLGVAVAAAAVLTVIAQDSHGGRRSAQRLEGTVNAPEFPEQLDWLNTGRRLRIADLRGKIVLLDFWTYCCINCIHVMGDLKKLEAKYPDELVVIGVHSAKFTGEKDTENIRQAIGRYELEHPVVNDHRMRVWRQYGVRAWPSFVLIDPAGKVVGRTSGEGIYAAMDKLIGEMIAHWEAKGKLDRRRLKRTKEADTLPRSLLAYPGKVLADEKSGRLFIADSNHNRIVVASLKDNAIQAIVGSGRIGFDDGDFAAATFDHPQGMALAGEQLYVADTENHAIRRVDLEKRTVTTVAGTGEQARRFNVAGGGRTTPLNSPWDLILHDDVLYIAMAGSHQLWQMSVAKTHYVKPYAGSSREDRIDGALLAAALAQPSGLAADGKRLYVADSETSSIRTADLGRYGRVRTLVGRALFTFGDRDGVGEQVRLQHPLGVAYHDGVVYVADTYNNKIKRLDPESRRCQSWLGSGKPGAADGAAGEATFDEPGGLSVAGGKLYIADTNNHLIRVADLKTGQVATLEFREPANLRVSLPDPQQQSPATRLPAQAIGPGEASLLVSVDLPEGCKLTPGASSAVTVRSNDGKVLRFGGKAGKAVEADRFPLTVPLTAAAGKTELTIELVIYYCQVKNAGLCFFHDARLLVPIEVKAGAGGQVSVSHAVPEPD